MFSTVEGQAGYEYDRDGVGHSRSKSRGCSSMSDRAHGERVIADGPPAATDNVGCGGPSRGRGSSGLAQPVVQRRDAALKLGQFVGVVDSATLRTESAFNAPG